MTIGFMRIVFLEDDELDEGTGWAVTWAVIIYITIGVIMAVYDICHRPIDESLRERRLEDIIRDIAR
jgi:uncharacterized Rmd1/YagE family protein